MAMESTKVLIKPLNGTNYATWKVQCRMALIKDGLWGIVDGRENAPTEEREIPKFNLRRDRALATIVLSVEPTLLYLLGPDPEDPTEVWKKLADQFQKKTWSNKLTLRRKLYDLKLKDGQSVQKHVKALTEIFDELAIIGDPLDDESKVVHLLASLPDSYDMLVTALEASAEVPKLEVVTERLLHEESKRKDKDTLETNVKAMTSNHGNPRKGPRCYHCGKIGHVKRYCKELTKKFERQTPSTYGKNRMKPQNVCTAEEEEDDDEEIISLVAENTLAVNGKSNWIVDSGATCHMCNEEELFEEISSLEIPQDITVGDGYSVQAIGKGTVTLEMNISENRNVVCKLSDVLFVPQLSYNLLSVSKGATNGKKFQFEDFKCDIVDAKHGIIGTATKHGNLYHLNCNGLRNKKNHTVMKCDNNATTKEEIWHRRYGHLGVQNLKRLARDKLVEGFDYDATKKPTFCEPCIDGKQSKIPFPKTGGDRSKNLLGIIHSDVCGKIETKSLSGAEYFVTFIDDKSRYVWVYVMKHKSEVFEKFKEWKATVEKSTGIQIKTFRTDNGGEYTSKEFEDYLKKEGIHHELTIPKTPQQNGVAERMNRTLVESVRSMLADSKLPKRFWAEALATATYLRNRCPTTAVKGKTPFEVLTGKKPNVENLRIFGCDAYAHVPKDERKKLDSKTKKSVFLGYGDGIKGYRLYDNDKKRVFYSRNVTFNEICGELKDDRDIDEPKVEIELQPREENTDNQIQEEQERQVRERRPPDRYGEWVYITQEEDPNTFSKAIKGHDADKWMQAMEAELDSLHKNEVWELTELPPNRKVVGSKWVYKKKQDADGNVERYKARLVAQGYNQRYGEDYDETTSPVVRFESIRTLIGLAVKKELHLHQLDVGTAFLNGELKETIYMKQPEGFEILGKEHLVCKLKKSIYGLKQSSRCWNEALDKHLKSMGFKQSNNDPCIYTLETDEETFIIAVYVDDIILAGNNQKRIDEFIKMIGDRFDIRDMGKMNHFLGVKIEYFSAGRIWIGQPSYTRNLLKKFSMENSKPVATPVEIGSKLIKSNETDKLVDPEMYQSVVGQLLYLSTRTRPDIAYAVSNVARFSSKPSQQHWIAVKRIMRYLNGTIDYGLLYEKNSTIEGFSDADWAGDLNDRKSTSGYVFMMSGAAISWNSKKQTCVALSTAEAEYIALSKASQESIWLRRLLADMGEKQPNATIINEDNQSAIAMTKNPQFHGRAKHIDMKYHYVREQVKSNEIQLKYCQSGDMIADIMTKGIGRVQFDKLRTMIGLKNLTDCE